MTGPFTRWARIALPVGGLALASCGQNSPGAPSETGGHPTGGGIGSGGSATGGATGPGGGVGSGYARSSAKSWSASVWNAVSRLPMVRRDTPNRSAISWCERSST
jgi:hypothetical protein